MTGLFSFWIFSGRIAGPSAEPAGVRAAKHVSQSRAHPPERTILKRPASNDRPFFFLDIFWSDCRPFGGACGRSRGETCFAVSRSPSRVHHIKRPVSNDRPFSFLGVSAPMDL